MASAKSTVYVVLGASESNSTVTLRPSDDTRGTDLEVGETTTFENASLTLTSSSNCSTILVRFTPSEPGGGLADTRRGGSSSRGPPDGLPMLAHPASNDTSAAMNTGKAMLVLLIFMLNLEPYGPVISEMNAKNKKNNS